MTVFANVLTGNPGVTFGSSTWTTYVPIVSNNGSKIFTCTGRWRQNGDSMEIEYALVGNATASGGSASVFLMSIPTGYTIDGTKLPAALGAAENVLGFVQTYSVEAINQFAPLAGVSPQTTTNIGFIRPGAANFYTASNFNNTNQVEFVGFVKLPIVEFAGGLQSVGAGPSLATRYGLQAPTTPQTNVTVTCPQAGFSVLRAVAIAYADTNNVWRMKFNLVATITTASVTGLTLTFAGTIFGAQGQALSIYPGGSNAYFRGYTNANTGQIGCDTATATSINAVVFSGDVELASKPTWAV